MNYSPPLDMIDSLMSFSEELSSLARVLLLVATVVEGLVYRRFLNRSWISAVAGSLVANLASALLGIVIGLALLTVLLIIRSFELYVVAVIVVSYAASVVVEGIAITLLYRQRNRFTWGVVSIANLTSYVITALVLLSHYLGTYYDT